MNGITGSEPILPLNTAPKRRSKPPAATPIRAGGGICFDVTQGNFSSAVFMANAYLDLGTWWCLTPYIGAGIGSAYNRITSVQDMASTPTAPPASALLGGLGELEFCLECPGRPHLQRQQQLQGRFQRPLPASGLAGNGRGVLPEHGVMPGASYNLNNTNSWDFRIGLRWMLQPDMVPVMAPPPLMSRG